MEKILDASALMIYLEREPGWEKMREAFIQAAETDRKLLMTTVNWGEVFYLLIRDQGLEEAKEILRSIDTFPLELVPAGKELTHEAAILKMTRKLGYMDSFAAALTKLRGGELFTSDKDFRSVEDEIKIFWIR